ncbi:hypothetical protein [Actinomadura macrotermitis]|uniref:Uncharacterized protein n=1 Tax=Actinomadura macrotermitis TaxID=2585200 RepID=A0A7K0C5Z1_9ACTN|nr:hypothetical protein [Actinomadura macrotermitis]MQY08881.1 hypothetical protein [Actinomadura macrotermitis]
MGCSRAEDLREAEIEEAEERARARIQALARALVEAGAGPDEQYLHATTTEPIGFLKFFGIWKYRTREDPEEHRYGWCIGTYDWFLEQPIRDVRFDSGGISRYPTSCRTYVTPDGDIVAHGGCRGHLSELNLSGLRGQTRTRDFLATVVTKMTELARARGVEIE